MLAKRLLLISATLACLQLPSFAAAQTFITAWGTAGTGESQFGNPLGVAVGGTGNVYVTDEGNHKVKVFTSDGSFLRQWSVPGTCNQYGCAGPENIAVDANDDVYVTRTEPNHLSPSYGVTQVSKCTSAGTLVTRLATVVFGANVAVDGLGNTYVSDVSNSRIQVFSSSGSYLREWGTPGSPDGLAVDAAGNVYVAQPGRFGLNSGVIWKFGSDGTLLTQWGGGAADAQFNPVRIAVGPDALIYVVDHDNARVQVFTSEGALVTMWGSRGASNGQFDNPIGIAIDANGNIYVADKNNCRIQKFGPAPTAVKSVTWGSMKARYRGAAQARQPNQ